VDVTGRRGILGGVGATLTTPTLKVETTTGNTIFWGRPSVPTEWHWRRVGDSVSLHGPRLSWPMTIVNIDRSDPTNIIVVVEPD
jgi:predicted sugar kinase